MKKVVLLSLILIVVGVVGSVGVGLVGFKNLGKEFEIKETLSTKDIKQIFINSEFADVMLHPSQDDQVHAHLKGNFPKSQQPVMKATGDQGDIHISVEQKRKHSIFNFSIGFVTFKQRVLHVYIPKKMFDKVRIETDCGKISSEQSMALKRLEMKTSYGDIFLHEFQGTEIKANTNYGDIHIERIDGSFDLATEMGDIEIDRLEAVKGNNKMHTEMGNAEVKFAKDPNPVKINLFTDLGNIETDKGLTHEVDRAPGSQGGASGTPTLSIHTKLGNIELEKLYQ
ncbi:DUF4097 and DUF4098 domain-containing protein YvlB [Croceifilum oryzae]|uniref:DUF4097 and DUF4098 domain-containing protein YvlB n=1 Tax=Croceifilum oryzae TaxID=1553429 RepID=A0AAJ1TIJ1_9BACL|nr:DUF4097 family beta strand repeat-containing protein [Croceifilum oryzae]MDQ0416629.1 DUF4097 and DUF4098 domain-containing protein YvlB [Croceifilum oryzae]